ncbi:cytochrome P450 2F2-like isoform X1 [Periophthalmus magnuspinnatus]|uniref:cytochrome P450 2F2-like isoform X1 n=1 Tax=Periophthalmus magnuspinnatus TaxID=409849 RepID=UPI00145BD8E3|nr:cytochrome P450 2F2-like isoform X1 [Periophthalmus magnuspinnatus]
MFVSVLFLLICLCFLLVQFKCRRPKNFPPGPFTLPFLGNALSLNHDNPMKYFESLRRTYGNVYSLYLGPRAAVMVNGTQALKEALVNKAVDFAGRPQDTFMMAVFEHKGVGLTDYGQKWKEQRRFAIMTMKNFGLGKQSMEERILGELQYTINKLKKNTGKSLSAQVMFHNIASNVICLVLFAKRFEYDDEFIVKYVENFSTSMKTINGPWSFLYDSFPCIRRLPLPFHKGLKAMQTAKRMTSSIINEHKKTRVPGQPRDFVDCYLDEIDKRANDYTSFSWEELLITCLQLHTAGTDTTSNTLLIGFLYLMTKPHIQERCQQEIDRVLEGKDFVTFEDRHDMPYVQAVVHESQRVADTVPLSLFHVTTRDTELMGYSIPKGTIVIPNLSSALNEEGQWKFPHEFNPANFLNDKGEFVKPDAFLPFSAGPRVCLGESLARMELFLIFVTLLRKFRFIWPEDAGEPDYELVFGLTTTPKPFNMKVELRAAQ